MMGYYYLLNGVAVSWYSKKQRTVSSLTTEAKYITFGHAAQEVVCLRRFFKEFQVVTQSVNSMTLYGDNETSIMLTKNTKS